MSSCVCSIDPEVIEEFKAFKNDRKLFNAAFISNKKNHKKSQKNR